MAPSRFTRMGGFGALLGGILWLLTLALIQFVAAAPVVLMPATILFVVIGFVALQARHAGRSGLLGRAGYAIGLLGCVLIVLGRIAQADVALSRRGTRGGGVRDRRGPVCAVCDLAQHPAPPQPGAVAHRRPGAGHGGPRDGRPPGPGRRLVGRHAVRGAAAARIVGDVRGQLAVAGLPDDVGADAGRVLAVGRAV